MTPQELVNAIPIDRANLDRHIEEQPTLLMEAADLLAQSISKRDAARDEKKRVYAEAYIEVKNSAAESNQKISEAAAAQIVEVDERYRTACENLVQQTKDANRAEAFVEAYKCRGSALRDLVQLTVSGFLARSSLPGVSDEAKKARAAINRSAAARIRADNKRRDRVKVKKKKKGKKE